MSERLPGTPATSRPTGGRLGRRRPERRPKRRLERRRLEAAGASLLTACMLICGLAACGNAVSVGSDRTLHVVVGEYQLRPDAARLSTGPLTIVVENLGRLSHSLVVASGNQWLGSTKPIWPGQSATMTLNLAPGKYSMFSALLADQSLGDYGTITVTG